MKFRWKLVTTLLASTSIFTVGAFLASPTHVDASLTADQKEQIMVMNEITGNIKKLTPRLDPGIQSMYAESIYINSKKTSLDPNLVISIIYRESEFNTTAKSTADCVGAMQINPKAHADKLKNITINELYYIDNNIRIGCNILKEYSAGGSIRTALKRYVGGDHPTYINDVLSTYAILKLEK